MAGTWSTNFRGSTYALDNNGRLRKTQPMTIHELLDQRYRDDFTNLEYRHRPHIIDRIIAEELEALRKRRAAHHDKENTP